MGFESLNKKIKTRNLMHFEKKNGNLELTSILYLKYLVLNIFNIRVAICWRILHYFL